MPGFDIVPYNDLAALEKTLASNPKEYAAFMVEPIQVLLVTDTKTEEKSFASGSAFTKV
jgi:glutamate-1-semialdehyde aminotransferase